MFKDKIAFFILLVLFIVVNILNHIFCFHFMEKLHFFTNRFTSFHLDDIIISSIIFTTIYSILSYIKQKKYNRKLKSNEKILKVSLENLKNSLSDSTIEEYADKTLDLLFEVPFLNIENKGCIFLANNKTKTLEMIASKNIHECILRSCKNVEYGDCLCGQSAMSGKMIFKNKVDGNHHVSYDGMIDHGHYIVPIIDGELIGVLCLYLKNGHEQNNIEEIFLNNISNAIANTIKRKRVERELKESEDKFRKVTENTHEAIISIDENGKITFWNTGAEVIFGYHHSDIIGELFTTLLPNRYYSSNGDMYSWKFAKPNAEDYFILDDKTTELFGLCKDGYEVPLELTLTTWTIQDGRIYSVIIRDITERKRIEQELWDKAFTDSLTKLPNRSLLIDRLNQSIEQVKRTNNKCALLFIDLDRFKYVNDTFGHAAGDKLLIEASQRIVTCVRKMDTVARQGGDEFVVVLSNVSSYYNIELIAAKIISELTEPFIIKEQEVFISGSIGGAVFPDVAADQETLMKHADTAMYKAKDAGKNCFKFFTKDLDEETSRRIIVERELRQALENGEFYLKYQPIIDNIKGKVSSVEVLLRWNNPTLGSVSPVEFIPIAEEIGLMASLGNWVLETACIETRGWIQKHYDDCVASGGCDVEQCVPWIAVNVSVAQLEKDNFVTEIKNILSMTEYPHSCLHIEITESMVMKSVDKFIEISKQLKESGIHISIDDFGTGYSSLNYLKRLNASTLKIDRSFIKDIPEDTDDMEIVNAVIAMAHKLKLKVVAEGVETVEQLNFLKEVGCDRIQGYYYSKPLLLEDLKNYNMED